MDEGGGRSPPYRTARQLAGTAVARPEFVAGGPPLWAGGVSEAAGAAGGAELEQPATRMSNSISPKLRSMRTSRGQGLWRGGHSRAGNRLDGGLRRGSLSFGFLRLRSLRAAHRKERRDHQHQHQAKPHRCAPERVRNQTPAAAQLGNSNVSPSARVAIALRTGRGLAVSGPAAL